MQGRHKTRRPMLIEREVIDKIKQHVKHAVSKNI